ncbi:MAG: OmpA family protein [Bacteroidota bacterium]
MKPYIYFSFLFFFSVSIYGQDKGQALDSNAELNSFFVFFPTASHTVDEMYQPDLEQLASQAQAQGDTLEIIGFTDNVGDAADNLVLSQQRASAVMAILQQKGLDTTLLKLSFFGEDQPKGDNATAEGRKQNRRVELWRKPPQEVLSLAPYQPEDAEDLLDFLIIKSGHKRIAKPLPRVPKNIGIQFQANPGEVASQGDTTVLLTWDYTIEEDLPKSVLLSVEGSKRFVDIPVNQASSKGKIELPFQYPSAFEEGQFTVLACLISKKGKLSMPTTTLVQINEPSPELVAAEKPLADTLLYKEENLNLLMDTLTMPENATLVIKEMPVPPQETQVSLVAKQHTVTLGSGGTYNFNYSYDSGDSRPAKVLFKISGSQGFYDIPVEVTATTGTIPIQVGVPTVLDDGTFNLVATLLNEKGIQSQPDTIQVNIERVGTGELQISLSWDDQSDQDLHVVDPRGEEIYFSNSLAASGGELDRDDEDGFGPENVYWLGNAPDGEYHIMVKDYYGTAARTSFVVTFNGLGERKQFNGSTINGSKVSVAKFVKQDGKLVWKE